MKFSKTYLQTMTDPSFPKEWREKGLEYKELKKLINGVVAELESLGLSADVLRDLLEPPEQAQASVDSTAPAQSTSKSTSSRKRPTSSGSNASETGPGYRHRSASSEGSHASHDTSDSEGQDDLSSSLVAGLARLSTGRPAPSGFVDPLSPLMEEEEARRRSVEQAMNVPPFTPAEAMPPAALLPTEQAVRPSPAGEWLSSISHPHHHLHAPPSDPHASTRGKKRSKRSPSPGGLNAELGSREGSEESTAGPSQQKARHLGVSDEDRTHLFRASPMAMLGIPRQADTTFERDSSADLNDGEANLASTSPSSSWRLGKKDLEQLRRNSHSAPGRPSSAGKRQGSATGAEEALETEADDERHDWGGHAWRERQGLGWDATQKAAGNVQRTAAQNGNGSSPVPGSKQGRWVQGKDGRRARAEYELAGTPEHPTPRIKLIIESPVVSDDESEDSAGSSDEGDDDDGRITELPPSLPGSRRPSTDQPAVIPPIAVANEDASADSAPQQPRMKRTREIIIPLTADTEFLDTLTASLTKLSELQKSQKDTFVTSTEDLCASVARAASPYATKNDLYVWREIFQLWVDMQIFESQREKDRGELSVDESEARLQRFAQELAKRGWLAESAMPSSPGGSKIKLSRSKEAMQQALTVSMKSSKSASAVEDFLRLNLALLDVKKFQRVNVEAARKILKKHDKRTALTASSGLRDFVRQQEAARAFTTAMGGAAAMMGGAGLPAESTGTLVAPAYGTHPSLAALLPSSTTGLLSESLPHILLSLLTTTLLPILPSVDDYSCAICTGLAWRPIRLDCSHLFCIRCLVKLQKAGKKHCPLCRAPDVVMSADGRNMDEATVNMLRMWFPHEVNEKEQENESDRKKEELSELGIRSEGKCVVM